MISDKLYSNHKVLIPSKKGVGGCSGLMVSTLDSVSRGFKTWPGQCVVFLGMTLYSQSASLQGTLNLEPHFVVCPAPSR